MRISVTLDDALHERLVVWAKAEDRSVGKVAARLIEFGLTDDENAVLTVPEEVRRLRRDVPPPTADMTPGEKVAKAMKPLQEAAAQLTRRTHETVLDHEWVGTGPRCIRFGCPDPKNKEAHR